MTLWHRTILTAVLLAISAGAAHGFPLRHGNRLRAKCSTTKAPAETCATACAVVFEESAAAVCPAGQKPVWETSESGTGCAKCVPVTGGTATHAVEISSKAKSLSLKGLDRNKFSKEKLLLSAAEAVISVESLLLDKACLEQGLGVIVIHYRYLDQTPGRIQVQVINDTLDISAWTTPLLLSPNYEDETRLRTDQTVQSVRDELARIEGIVGQ